MLPLLGDCTLVLAELDGMVVMRVVVAVLVVLIGLVVVVVVARKHLS